MSHSSFQPAAVEVHNQRVSRPNYRGRRLKRSKCIFFLLESFTWKIVFVFIQYILAYFLRALFPKKNSLYELTLDIFALWKLILYSLNSVKIATPRKGRIDAPGIENITLHRLASFSIGLFQEYRQEDRSFYSM